MQDVMGDPIAVAASSNPDIMYLHETMKAPDSAEFKTAMSLEVGTHDGEVHWQLFLIKDLPPGTKVLPAVCTGDYGLQAT